MEEVVIWDEKGKDHVCGTYRLVLSPVSAAESVEESFKGTAPVRAM